MKKITKMCFRALRFHVTIFRFYRCTLFSCIFARGQRIKKKRKKKQKCDEKKTIWLHWRRQKMVTRKQMWTLNRENNTDDGASAAVSDTVPLWLFSTIFICNAWRSFALLFVVHYLFRTIWPQTRLNRYHVEFVKHIKSTWMKCFPDSLVCIKYIYRINLCCRCCFSVVVAITASSKKK